jgi:L,D-transpeptidase catalytic domain
MKPVFYPVSFGGMLILLLMGPSLRAGSSRKTNNTESHTSTITKPVSKSESPAFIEEVSSLYIEIDLKSIGLSQKAFEYAYKGYTYLLHHHSLSRPNVISICDFSQSSRNKRLYVVDLEQKKVLINTYVAHGRKSGSEYARSFSNRPESHKSSLGFYLTEQTYYGDHGLALKIHGLERGFNDRADSRNIVIHGSEYVGPDFLRWNRCNGRSFGCPAVPSSETAELIQTIKNGSCLFIYYPTKKYIKQSKILNG